VIRIHCAATVYAGPPLIIVDGELMPDSLLNLLKPEDIESVSILKDAAAMAIYGSRGMNGVIIVKTKDLGFRSFYAMDAEDNAKLANATFTFSAVDGTDSLRLIADEQGQVVMKAFPVGKKYRVTISCTGYKDFQTFYTGEKEKSNQRYRLSRDVKTNEEVIVPAAITCVLRRLTMTCGGVYSARELRSDSLYNELKSTSDRLYPNPVVRGGIVKLEMDAITEIPLQVRIASSGGATLSIVTYKPAKGMNRIAVPIAGQWVAGVYFVQVITQNGKLLKQNKLIIQ